MRRNSDKKQSKQRGNRDRCVRKINLSLKHERNMFDYFVLHFIEMYTSYLTACKLWITQNESTMRDKGE